MTPQEFRARMEKAGAQPVDVAYVAGVSLRAVRMALSPTGWKGRAAEFSDKSQIAQALPKIEAGRRAPPGVTYTALDGLYMQRRNRASKWKY